MGGGGGGVSQLTFRDTNRFFTYFVHKLVPIQNACVQKRGLTQTKIEE